MDFSRVTHPEARDFLESFFTHRAINREFYQRVPEEKFDFRMVNTPEKKSDSPRENLAHQINVQRTYMKAVDQGELKFGDYYDQKIKAQTKEELLTELEKADRELIDLLTDEEKLKKKVVVPWNKEGVEAVGMFWALNEHEILHTGLIIAMMDHLNMERFSALKKVWG